MAVSSLSKYLTQGAIEGFAIACAPLSAFSYVVKPGPASVNDVVRVPYSAVSAGSSVFSYSTGYATDNATIVGKPVTLNQHLYGRVGLTDSDLGQLNEQALVGVGRTIGARLGVDFVSASFAATLTEANYGNSGSYNAAAYSSSAALVALDKAANDYSWPEQQRSLLANTTLWSHLLNNSMINNAANFGTGTPIQQGKMNTVIGFTPYKVGFSLPNSANGIAVSPNAICLANAYHAPQDSGTAYIEASQVVDEQTGLTLGYREYYDPKLATKVRAFDVLGGAAVGNANALYWVK